MVASIDEMLALYDRISTIATVGASTNPEKPAHSVPAYLIEQGYRVIPVNPTADEIHGVPAVASLAGIDESIDLVQVFRPSEEAPEIARQAVAAGASALWLQLGIESDEAAAIAEEAGLTVVMNACMRAVHKKHLRTEG
jgi:predicted CoA-binding protein